MTTDYAVNIMSVYRDSLFCERLNGEGWYARARDLALELSPDDVWKGAGVLAAFSPLKTWGEGKGENITLARQAFATGEARGHFGSQCAKANRIMAGEHPLDVLGGKKTLSFCVAIATAGRGEVATIDGHAYDAAMGYPHAWESRRINKTDFDEIAAAYLEVAEYLGLAVNDLQAIVWVAWKRMKKESRRAAA
jgi:hypothetical protein